MRSFLLLLVLVPATAAAKPRKLPQEVAKDILSNPVKITEAPDVDLGHIPGQPEIRRIEIDKFNTDVRGVYRRVHFWTDGAISLTLILCRDGDHSCRLPHATALVDHGLDGHLDGIRYPEEGYTWRSGSNDVRWVAVERLYRKFLRSSLDHYED